MKFKTLYLTAMREQAPGMMRALKNAGKLQDHIDLICARAHRMKAYILADQPRSEDGWIIDLQAERDAEFIVFEKLIQFPSIQWDPCFEPVLGAWYETPAASVPTSADEDQDCWGCQVRSAVHHFADARFDDLAAAVAADFAVSPASRYFEDQGYEFLTLWDEYCHEVQQGPFPAGGYLIVHCHEYLMEAAFDPMIKPTIALMVNALPRAEAVLLSIGARYHQDSDDHTGTPTDLDPSLICKVIRSLLNERASDRDMGQFIQWRHCGQDEGNA